MKHRKKLARLQEAISVNWHNHAPEEAVVAKDDLRAVLNYYQYLDKQLNFMMDKYEALEAKYWELLDRYASGA